MSEKKDQVTINFDKEVIAWLDEESGNRSAFVNKIVKREYNLRGKKQTADSMIEEADRIRETRESLEVREDEMGDLVNEVMRFERKAKKRADEVIIKKMKDQKEAKKLKAEEKRRKFAEMKGYNEVEAEYLADPGKRTKNWIYDQADKLHVLNPDVRFGFMGLRNCLLLKLDDVKKEAKKEGEKSGRNDI